MESNFYFLRFDQRNWQTLFHENRTQFIWVNDYSRNYQRFLNTYSEKAVMKHHLYEPSVLLPWSICHRLSQPVCPWQACLPGRPPPCTAAAAACAFSVRFSDLWQLDVQPSDSPYYTLQGCGKRGEFYKLPTDMSRPKAAPPSLLHPKVQKKLKSLVSIRIFKWLIDRSLLGI